MSINVSFLDKDKKEIEITDYYANNSYICFSCILSPPNDSYFIRFRPKINSSVKDSKKFLEILFDIFPFMKECIEESIDEIIKEKQITISTDNHHGIILSSLVGTRYIQDFDGVVEQVLKFKKDGASNIEAFSKAHDAKLIKKGDRNDNHTLLPFNYQGIADWKKWSKNFKKKFDVNNLKNGHLTKDGKVNRIVHCSIIKTFYTEVVK